MVLSELSSARAPRRSEAEKHCSRSSPAVRAVLQQPEPAQMQALWDGPSRQAVNMKAIDIHNHFFPQNWPDLAKRYGTPDWPWIKHTEPGKAEIMLGDRFFRHIYSACWDPEVRLAEMDRDGVEMQIISATPVLFAYDRPIAHAA